MMDLKQAEDMKGSFLWAGIVEELDHKITYEVAKLRMCQPDDLIKVQLTIQCYESLKRLADDIIDRESQ